MIDATKRIEIENIGAIERLSIPIPEAGGVVVLRGRNGAGKSTAIDATNALLSGKGSLPVRDDCQRGQVNGLGVTVKVGKNTRRAGELTAISLEDRLNIADLVDPHLKSDDAADARRIKALVALTGAKADPTLFPKEAQAELEKVDDLVEMAAVAKRNLQALARTAEKQADTAAGEASGLRSAAGDVPADAPDEETARKAVEAAIRAQADLKARYEAAAQREFAAAKAREAIEKHQLSDAPRVTVTEARSAVDAAQVSLDKARGILLETEKLVRDSEETLRLAQADFAAATQHDAAMRGWQTTIEAAEEGDSPDEDELKAANAALDAARATYETAVAAKAARERLARADAASAQARTHAAEAERLRQLADSTDDVLAEAIQSDVLKVRSGRLITTTGRGPTLFADLSEGERWRIALDIAADRVGEGGIITVPQDAWEGLDATNRAAIAQHARERSVVILTAEAQREGEGAELRAEVATA